jgi:hypothetical protein
LIAHQAGFREPAVDLLRRAAGLRRDDEHRPV